MAASLPHGGIPSIRPDLERDPHNDPELCYGVKELKPEDPIMLFTHTPMPFTHTLILSTNFLMLLLHPEAILRYQGRGGGAH